MFTLHAPAKINWFLHVVSRRDDGYHDIRTLMQCVTLTDSITFEHSERLEIITDAPIPMEGNLVYKAARALKEAAGVAEGARMTLRKDVPVGAGLGGGSSDAAMTLLGLKRLWGLDAGRDDLAAVAAHLGSDVPFFLHGPCCLVGGRGGKVSPIRIGRSYTLLMVKPEISVSTAWAYSAWDSALSGCDILTKKANDIRLLCQALGDGDLSLFSSLQRNDLEAGVVGRFPIVAEIKRDLIERGALFSAMSGSGSTVFGVFDSEAEAGEASKDMADHWCRVVKTVAVEDWQEITGSPILEQ